MQLRIALLASATCVIGFAAQAEQGALDIRPRVSNDAPLTVELHNLSKQRIRLTQATLQFQDKTGHACSFSLPEPVSVGPADMASFSFAANSDVAKCATLTGATMPGRRLSVLTARELAQTPLTRTTTRRAADFSYVVEIGKRAATEKTVWHFLEQ